jgi:hypothetical protein
VCCKNCSPSKRPSAPVAWKPLPAAATAEEYALLMDGAAMVAAVDAVVVAVVVSRALFQNPKSIGLVAGGGLIWSCSCRSGCDGNSSIDLSPLLLATCKQQVVWCDACCP